MKHYLKSALLLTCLVLCTIAPSTLQAQISQSAAMHQRLHQQAIYQIDMMRRFRTEGMSPTMKQYQGKYKFYIVTLDGDTIDTPKKIKVQFYEPINKLTYKGKSKGEKITFTPDQTKEIFVRIKSTILKGIPYADHWIFNTISTDSIQFYAHFPEPDISFINQYQIKGDSIRPLTIEAMSAIAKGNAKAEKQLKKKKLHKALEIYIQNEQKWQKTNKQADSKAE